MRGGAVGGRGQGRRRGGGGQRRAGGSGGWRGWTDPRVPLGEVHPAQPHAIARCVIPLIERAVGGAGGVWTSPAPPAGVQRRFIPQHLSGTWGCNFRVWAGQLTPPLEARHLAWCGRYLRAEDVGAGAPAAVAGVMHGLEPAVAMARRAEGVRIGLNTILALWPMAAEVRLWAGVAEAVGVEPGDDDEALGEAVRGMGDDDTGGGGRGAEGAVAGTGAEGGGGTGGGGGGGGRGA